MPPPSQQPPAHSPTGGQELGKDEDLVEKKVDYDDMRRARFLSWLSLSLLVFQNCAAVLMMRWTQTRKTSTPYSPAAVVVVTEVVKLLICAVCIVAKRMDLRECLRGEPTKMIVPAGLYAFQNNVLYVALANLEATLFQVTYQAKLLVTAVLMVMMLGKKLTQRKWAALVLLFVGIVLTQVDAKRAVKPGAEDQNIMLGLMACVASSLSSAFASVYFEKVVKNASTSLLVRNVQLAFFSIFIAGAAYPLMEGRKAADFLNGFDSAVGILIAIQAAGGLIVAAVIKYADNIQKGFATAIAILVNGLVSFLFLDFSPTFTFLCGVITVMVATTLYSLPEAV